MTISLNARIKVKLTDPGREIYRQRFADINEWAGREVFPEEAMTAKVDRNGYSEFQLWDFMNIFGPYIGIGRPNVIEPVEIKVIGPSRTS